MIIDFGKFQTVSAIDRWIRRNGKVIPAEAMAAVTVVQALPRVVAESALTSTLV